MKQFLLKMIAVASLVAHAVTNDDLTDESGVVLGDGADTLNSPSALGCSKAISITRNGILGANCNAT